MSHWTKVNSLVIIRHCELLFDSKKEQKQCQLFINFLKSLLNNSNIPTGSETPLYYKITYDGKNKTILLSIYGNLRDHFHPEEIEIWLSKIINEINNYKGCFISIDDAFLSSKCTYKNNDCFYVSKDTSDGVNLVKINNIIDYPNLKEMKGTIYPDPPDPSKDRR